MEARQNPAAHGARWCDRHSRWECAKQRSRGRGQCHGSAVTGTDACRLHVGKTVANARRDALTAWAAVPGDNGISPRMAVAAHLGLAWRRAELLGSELRKQVEAASAEPGAAGGLVGGLVGQTWSASVAAGGIYPTGERARALAELERAERELVVRFAEIGHRMGLDEARLALAHAHGTLIAELISAALARLGLDPRDQEVRAAVYAELASGAYQAGIERP